MTIPPIDPERLEREWEADLDVLASLASNGDRPEIERPVDVNFRGSQEALEALAARAADFGFVVIETETSEDGDLSLFLERSQPADEASIRALTETCLQIELIFGLEYEGWGCVAETGLIH